MIQLINILMEQAGYPINQPPCRVAKGHPYPDPCISHQVQTMVRRSMPRSMWSAQEVRFELDWWYGRSADDAE